MRTESHRFTIFLASIAALTSLSIDMSLPTLPAIEHEFGIAAGRGALTMSVFLAGYVLAPLIGGPLADRFGRRPLLLTSLATFALAAFACSLSPDFPLLLLFRLIQGCAAGAATTLPIAIVRDLLAGSVARQRMSEVTTINSIMPIVAPLLGSAVMLLGRWRLLFGTQAVFAALVVVALLLDFKESLPSDRRHRVHLSALLRSYLLLLRNRVFLGYALINGLGFASIFAFISASPLILMQRMGVPHSTYPFVFALIAIGQISGSFASAVLSRRHASGRALVTSGLGLMSVASCLAAGLQIAGLHTPAAIVPPVFVTLFGFGLIVPSVNLGALEPVPTMAGSASGVLRSILMIFGSGTSAFLAAYCGRHFMQAEVATTLTMSFAALLALGIYVLWLRDEGVDVAGHATSSL